MKTSSRRIGSRPDIESRRLLSDAGAGSLGRASPQKIFGLASHLRDQARRVLPPSRIAAALAKTCALWRERGFAERRQTISLVSGLCGVSPLTLDESLDALLKPFQADAFERFSRVIAARNRLFGFVMPGNVLGAGLHEVCQVLVAGDAILLKTSSAEPFFFPAFARTLRTTDPEVGARLGAIGFGRERIESSAALSNVCDCLVAFGDDESLSRLAGKTQLIGFGSRASGAFVAQEAASNFNRTVSALAVARDVCLFEQRGCLSPHHIFVEDRTGQLAAEFARELAQALVRLAQVLPPPANYPLEDAAAVRHVRETARWRQLGGEEVELLEGESFAWTVIFDRKADFSFSPGYRVVYVSGVRDFTDLQRRLAPARGHLEAFAIADPARRFDDLRASLSSLGVSYVPEPGEMQSPPLDWRHGGGILLDLLLASS
jgi:Acyl-CoA reductase (LuxC)